MIIILFPIFHLHHLSSVTLRSVAPRPALAVPSCWVYTRFRDTDVPRLLPVKVYYPHEHVTNAACNV